MENSAISSDLIRGHINTIILRTLYEGDKYGYAICDDIEKKTAGQYVLKQPTLYSALKRLESQGFVKSYWGTVSAGGRRRYYALTDLGKEITEKNQAEWEYSRTVIDKLISEKEYNLSDTPPSPIDFNQLKKSVTRVKGSDLFGDETEETENAFDGNFGTDSFEDEILDEYEKSLNLSETADVFENTNNFKAEANIETTQDIKRELKEEILKEIKEEIIQPQQSTVKAAEEPVILKAEPAVKNYNDDALFENTETPPERDYKNILGRLLPKREKQPLNNNTAAEFRENTENQEKFEEYKKMLLEEERLEEERRIAKESEHAKNILFNNQQPVSRETRGAEPDTKKNISYADEYIDENEFNNSYADDNFSLLSHRRQGNADNSYNINEMQQKTESIKIRTSESKQLVETKLTHLLFNKILSHTLFIVFGVMIAELLLSAIIFNGILHWKASSYFIIASALLIIPFVGGCVYLANPNKKIISKFVFTNSLVNFSIYFMLSVFFILGVGLLFSVSVLYPPDLVGKIILPIIAATNLPVSVVVYSALLKYPRYFS